MTDNLRNRKVKYAVGDVIGNWTVVALVKKLIVGPSRSFRRTDFLCRCVCGKEVLRRRESLAIWATTSCGCTSKSHGLAKRGRKHPVYLAWQGMMTRCYNTHRAQWKNYGGRGIKVHAAWHDPQVFIADMLSTWSPGMTLDRKDNDKDYSASNCRWLSRASQQQNKRNSVLVSTPGGRMCLTEAVRRYGVVGAGAVWYRLRQGWDDWAALTTPKSPGRTGRPKKLHLNKENP
jgi:hypothetical protein